MEYKYKALNRFDLMSLNLKEESSMASNVGIFFELRVALCKSKKGNGVSVFQQEGGKFSVCHG